MYIVVKTHNFDTEMDATVFQSRKDAEDYLQWAWQEYYNEELAAGSDIVENECYHESDFAKIEWEDGDQTWFAIVVATSPDEKYKKPVQKPMKTWTICHREELCGYFDIDAETPEDAMEEYYYQVEEGKIDFGKLNMIDSSDTFV